LGCGCVCMCVCGGGGYGEADLGGAGARHPCFITCCSHEHCAVTRFLRDAGCTWDRQVAAHSTGEFVMPAS
jgi:hypothetical protein